MCFNSIYYSCLCGEDYESANEMCQDRCYMHLASFDYKIYTVNYWCKLGVMNENLFILKKNTNIFSLSHFCQHFSGYGRERAGTNRM